MSNLIWFSIPTAIELAILYSATVSARKLPKTTSIVFAVLAAGIAYLFGVAERPDLRVTSMKGYARSVWDSSPIMYDELPIPSVPRHAALVKVKASSLNPVDYKLVFTRLPFVRWLRPNTFGMDFAGEMVHKHSYGCEDFEVGDRVYGTSLYGSLAQYTVVSCSHLGKIPKKMSFVEASTLPVAAIAGWGSLAKVAKLHLRNDLNAKSLLVVGASGGCGSMGVKLGSSLGFGEISTVQSSKSVEFVKLNVFNKVFEFFNYDDQESIEELKSSKFDYIYDTVTSPSDFDYYPLLFSTLKNASDGERYHYLAINGTLRDVFGAVLNFLMPFLRFERPSFNIFRGTLNSQDYADFNEHALKCVPPISKTFEFEQDAVDSAFKELKSRRAKGKLVVVVDPK